MSQYEVVVGNVGTVYTGTDRREATRTFHQYVARIVANQAGRANDEGVVLFENGEVLAEKEARLADEN